MNTSPLASFDRSDVRCVIVGDLAALEITIRCVVSGLPRTYLMPLEGRKVRIEGGRYAIFSL